MKACVELSSRYIQDRHLPDKAIDLLDEAGSKLNLTLKEQTKKLSSSVSPTLEQEKQAALENEDYETAATLRDEEAQLEKRSTR